MKSYASVCVALLVLAAVLSSPARAGVVGYFDVRGTIPSSAALGQPFRWSVTNVDGDLSNRPCVIYLNTYGTAVPNGYFEFPSVAETGIGLAADWCRGLSPGQTVCAEGEIQSPPDLFGQTYRVTGAHLCQ
jgi:hypothetical protein